MTPERLEKLKEQAFASIIWGERKEDVVKTLVSGGVDGQQARQIVKDAQRERARDIRETGFKNIMYGAGFILLSVILIGGYYMISQVIFLKLVGVMAIPGAWGVFKLLQGIPRVILGQEGGAISDMD